MLRDRCADLRVTGELPGLFLPGGLWHAAAMRSIVCSALTALLLLASCGDTEVDNYINALQFDSAALLNVLRHASI